MKNTVKISKLSLSLRKIPYLSLISKLAGKLDINVWLVGGALRDIYLKKEGKLIDFDFCVTQKTALLVKKFADEAGLKFIILDKREESYRVILKRKECIYTYDFTRIRGESFKRDLALRDFSINTLAVDLRAKKFSLLDYLRAAKDLKSGVIKAVGLDVIRQDPVRILRGFAFMVNYGFRIENRTLKMMVDAKKLINKSSPERINEELFKILKSKNSYPAVKIMSKTKIIDEVIPHIVQMRGVSQGSFHHLDVWNHSLETLRQFELLYNQRLVKNKNVSAYLNEELAQGRRRIQILKLAALLHDIGKPAAKKKLKKRTIFHTHEKIGRDLAGAIADKLRFSLREREVLKKMVFWHLRPGYLADQIIPTKRAVYRFFRDTQREGAGVILLSLSDWRATRGPKTSEKKRKRHEKIMLKLVDEYFTNQKRKPLLRLVDGYNIMSKLNVTPGPIVGEILKKINEEQALGKITSKKEAYELAKNIVKEKLINKGKLQ